VDIARIAPSVSQDILSYCGGVLLQPEPPLGWLDEAEVVGYLWTDDESQAQRWVQAGCVSLCVAVSPLAPGHAWAWAHEL
jgi:hypothetical protein